MIAKLLFRLLNPEKGSNFISREYLGFKLRKQASDNAIWEKSRCPSYFFDVPGAGRVCISKSSKHRCGKAVGFSIGCEWGEFGFAGGVMDKQDARLLASHIMDTISEHEDIVNK